MSTQEPALNQSLTSEARPSAPASSQSQVRPRLDQQAAPTQDFGQIVRLPNGLAEDVCRQSITALNQVLADTMTLRDLYKKHHWQVVGPTFDQLHLLFDKHFEEQAALVDVLAERIQVLGGISVAMAADVAELTLIERPPAGREPAARQLSRLLEAHEAIIVEARRFSREVDDAGDYGSNDVLVSNVLRTNVLQLWFVSEHLVAASPV
jgi:starvation-inducible DNA-binding protein